MPSFGRLTTHPGTRSGRRVRNRRRRASSRGPLRLCFDVLQHLLALVTVADVEIDATKLLPWASNPSFQRLETPPGGRYGRRRRNRPCQAAFSPKWLQPRLQPLRFNVVQRPPAIVTVADVEIDPAKLPCFNPFVSTSYNTPRQSLRLPTSKSTRKES
ncbi:hypothetical protein B0H16DRAFT_425828 [Mycena metata]|uniref:Uncharacterized protein n=1 Tax=Mycena metata TaxID=1033252 RepID=A0AAD7MHS4_9AGAR|nr:hypothetical protein B0H16DRAFT_425828 [Mycena metata]